MVQNTHSTLYFNIFTKPNPTGHYWGPKNSMTPPFKELKKKKQDPPPLAFRLWGGGV